MLALVLATMVAMAMAIAMARTRTAAGFVSTRAGWAVIGEEPEGGWVYQPLAKTTYRQ